MPPSVTVRCPAKINLFLEVLGRRPDGYHEIVTVMAPIALYDRLTVRPSRRDILEVDPASAAPADPTNTVWRALEELRKLRPFPPVRMTLEKHIPSGTGLGGGSSDAAGLVRAIHRLFNPGLTKQEMTSAMARVGSDTAFFLQRRWAVCTGRGEIVTPIRAPAPMCLVLVIPPFSNPTADIYRRYRHGGPRRPLPRNPAATPFFNRLEEPAFARRPELRTLKQAMQKLPFRAALMTGSGSCLFGVCPDPRARPDRMRDCRRLGVGVIATRTL